MSVPVDPVSKEDGFEHQDANVKVLLMIGFGIFATLLVAGIGVAGLLWWYDLKPDKPVTALERRVEKPPQPRLESDPREEGASVKTAATLKMRWKCAGLCQWSGHVLRWLMRLVGASLLPGLLLVVIAPVRADAPFDPFAAAGIEQKPGAQVPLELRFAEVNGNHITLGELFGQRPVILAPVYYRCPNVCGAQLASLFNLLSALSFELGKDYEVIAFSIDPRETPQDAEAERAKLLERWPQLVDSPHVHFLSEVAPATRPEPNPAHPAAGNMLAEAVGFRSSWDPEIGEFAHASAIATLSP